MYPWSYLFFLNKFLNGAWYEPSLDDRIQWMVQLLSIKPGEKAIDIGSGDGRLVIAMARHGAMAFGIEQDKNLVKRSRQLIHEAKLDETAHIIEGDFWEMDYHDFQKVSLYQFKTVMGRLEQKLQAELPQGAMVVSNYWKFPTWKINDHIGDVYLYRQE